MMGQLLCHLWGDYILQSDWMAQNKTKSSLAAFVHAFFYMLAFLFLHPSVAAFAAMFWTHFFIDRYRLARYMVWAKNWIGPRKKWFRKLAGGCPYWTDEAEEGEVFRPDGYNAVHAPTPPFWACRATGYPPNAPAWLSVWLLIIADNTLHLTINYLALRFL
jgi:hypothetical protein